MGLTKSAGARSMKAITPSQVAEPVSCQVSHPTATLCSHEPVWETKSPVTKMR